MKRIFLHYPISILVVIAIIYLSCFKPPQTSIDDIPDIDKWAHICMYFGLSALIWFEFFRYHRHDKNIKYQYGWCIALLFPIVLGSTMEIIQKYCTTYRGFEWGDILADSVGAVLSAIIVAVYIARRKKRGNG